MLSGSAPASRIPLLNASVHKCTKCLLCEAVNSASCLGKPREESTLCAMHWFSDSLSGRDYCGSAVATSGTNNAYLTAALAAFTHSSASGTAWKAAFPDCLSTPFFAARKHSGSALPPVDTRCWGTVNQTIVFKGIFAIRSTTRSPHLAQRHTSYNSKELDYCSGHSSLAAPLFSLSVAAIITYSPLYGPLT